MQQRGCPINSDAINLATNLNYCLRKHINQRLHFFPSHIGFLLSVHYAKTLDLIANFLTNLQLMAFLNTGISFRNGSIERECENIIHFMVLRFILVSDNTPMNLQDIIYCAYLAGYVCIPIENPGVKSIPSLVFWFETVTW